MKDNINPYKKNYNKSKKYNTDYKIKDKIKDKIIEKEKTKSIVKQSCIYSCNKCSIVYTNPTALKKHYNIHINPVHCPFDDCNRMFSPSHTYQYRQHIDCHNGGLNIKCKFCNIISKTVNSNILHMKNKHKKEYDCYMNNINKYSNDNNVLQPKQIINLTQKYNKEDEEYDTELTYIENNKNKEYKINKIIYNYYENNLELLATVALSNIM